MNIRHLVTLVAAAALVTPIAGAVASGQASPGGGSGGLGPRGIARLEPLESARGRARALASADFDEDGIPDLISGYDDAGRGVIALHLADLGSAQPFHAPLVFDLPEPADFIGAGDFDNDGHMDVIAAALGGGAIYLLPGDGRGGFGDPERRTLSGTLTALATGEVDRPDGLADVAVALTGAGGSAELQVFESPLGAWRAQPESFPAGERVERLAVGDLDGDFLGDVGADSRGQVVVVRGRDRKLSLGTEARATVPRARVDRLAFGSPEASRAFQRSAAGGVVTLPMRLNGDALDDVVILQDGATDPLAIGRTSPLTTYIVTNTNDSGAGSLRAAIAAANGSLGADAISFNFPGGGPYIIAPLSPLPNITDPVTLDGTTQPGFAGAPIIEINGAGAGAGADGLVIVSGASAVRGLVIRGFDGNGIRLRSGGGNVIEGNYIGTDVTGSMASGNHLDGIAVNDSPLNTIGGTAAGARNVVSANQANGIEIDAGPGIVTTYSSTDVPKFIADLATTVSTLPVAAPGTVIDVNVTVTLVHTFDADLRIALIAPDGTRVSLSLNNGGSGDNYLGTVFDDSGAVPISSGSPPFASPPSYIPQSPLSAINGGPAGGVWTLEVADTAGGDVGELQAWSIRLTTAPSFGNQVLGNFIGTNATGSAALGNLNDGVRIVNSPGNVVGSPAPGARNVISGNVASGVETVLAGAVKNLIQANFIGTDVTGSSALPQTDGIYLRSGQNLVGGTAAGAGNVVSGNGSGSFEVGIHVSGDGNVLQGNRLGTNAAGTLAVPNYFSGVQVDGSFNTVGGGVAGAGNQISGNTFLGITLGFAGGNNTVQGNLIGTNPAGTAAVSNGTAGINVLESATNLIGGSTSAERNVISGNLSLGVALGGSMIVVGNNRVQGNYIGTDITGTSAIPNGYEGLKIGNQSNIIGGPVGTGQGNLISGNMTWGITFDTSARLNSIVGNIIGLDTAGSSSLPNRSGGIIIGGSENTIGGSNSGEGNTISANGGPGIHIISYPNTTITTYTSTDVPKAIADLSTVTSTITVPDTSIIVDVDVKLSLTHTFDGDLSITLIGPGGSALFANRRGGSGDNYTGTIFDDEGGLPIASGSAPFASPPSYIPDSPLAAFDGMAAAGTWTLQISDLAAGDVGTLTSWSITVTTLSVPYGKKNTIQGNHVGTDMGGSLARGNTGPGILIEDSAGNTIGDSSSFISNTISANQQEGITLTGAGSVGNVIDNNLIGLGGLAHVALPNLSDGIRITAGASANRIGLGARNVIALNGGAGVHVMSGRSNPIQGNSIRDNAGLGIDLDPAGVTPNDPGDGDSGPNDLLNYPAVTAVPSGGGTLLTLTFSGRPNSLIRLDVYGNAAPDPSGFGEGLDHLGFLSGFTDGAGNLSGTFFYVGPLGFFTATATDWFNNTSEFSGVVKTVLEASPAKDMAVERSGPLLKVTYTPACGATDHVIYWGQAGPAPIGPAGLSWINAACGMGVTGTAFFDPGTPEIGKIIYFVIAGQNGSVEGSYGQDWTGAERPEAVLPVVCDKPQMLGGICS